MQPVRRSVTGGEVRDGRRHIDGQRRQDQRPEHRERPYLASSVPDDGRDQHEQRRRDGEHPRPLTGDGGADGRAAGHEPSDTEAGLHVPERQIDDSRGRQRHEHVEHAEAGLEHEHGVGGGKDQCRQSPLVAQAQPTCDREHQCDEGHARQSSGDAPPPGVVSQDRDAGRDRELGQVRMGGGAHGGRLPRLRRRAGQVAAQDHRGVMGVVVLVEHGIGIASEIDEADYRGERDHEDHELRGCGGRGEDGSHGVLAARWCSRSPDPSCRE